MHISRITLVVALPLALAGPIKLESRGLLSGLPLLGGGAASAPVAPVAPVLGASAPAPQALPPPVGLPVDVPIVSPGGSNNPLPLPLPLPVDVPLVGGGGLPALPVSLPVGVPSLPVVGGGGAPLPLPLQLPTSPPPVVDDYPAVGGPSNLPPVLPPPVVTPGGPVVPGGPSNPGGKCHGGQGGYLSGLLDGINLIGKGYGSWPGIPAYPGSGVVDKDYLAKRLILDNAKIPISIPNLGTNLGQNILKGAPILNGSPILNGALNGLLPGGLLAKE